MANVITGLHRLSDGSGGLSRDMRVRWALEEVGQPYEVRLISYLDSKRAAHRLRHPFGQIPTYEDGDLVLFESGAIVLHIANTYPGLLPSNRNGRARATAWMFAALNTVEQAIAAGYTEPVRHRLAELSHHLGDAQWLEHTFTAGDLLMVTVLRALANTTVLQEFPNLVAYVARGEARPAFSRALVRGGGDPMLPAAKSSRM